jgi:predicted HAD superfamily Cof-like phosphohydrolase
MAKPQEIHVFHSDYSLRKVFTMVEDFHSAFKIEEKPKFDTVDPQTAALRFKLLQEENKEYLEACADMDKVAIADALGDLLYVLIGTMRVHGMEDLIYPIFKEIHKSNMSKLDEDGKPIYREDGKVMKSARFSAPNLQSIITRYETGTPIW